MLANDFPQVLDDELAGFEGLLGADAPALLLGAEPLQALHPLVPLDALVAALLAARARVGGALRKDHPQKEFKRVRVKENRRGSQRKVSGTG